MNLFKLAFVASGLLALASCADGDDTAIDDTTGPAPSGPVLIQEIGDPSCTGSTWNYSAKTDGWTSSSTLDIDQDTTNPWSEQHDMNSVDYADDGSWDLLGLDLMDVATVGEQEANSTSLFDCNDADRKATMMWMIKVWDMDNVMTDCAVWGADVSIYAGDDCLNWN
jgi:hypothetical protein